MRYHSVVRLHVIAAVVLPLACQNDALVGNDASVPDAGADVDADVPLPLDPEIATLLGSVDEGRITTTVTTLVGFGTRSSCSDASSATQGIGAARDWIKAQMTATLASHVMLHTFSQTGCGGATMPRDNVMGWMESATHPERLIVIGGHYDSRTVDVTDGVSPAPGANDSGSQTSVVLEAMRVMNGHAFDATIVFVAFAGEEQGLVGSTALAKTIGWYFPGATVEAMLNCDIVGGDSTSNDANALQQFRLYSPGTPREITSPDGTPDDTSPSRGLMRYVGTWGAAYVPEMAMIPKLREDRPGRGGDHESFIAQGYPGVRFIEPVETLAHEHTPNDLFMYVTPSYTSGVARVVVATASSLARAPSPPLHFSASGSADAPTLTWSAPETGNADHYVVALRAATDNLYRARGLLASATSATVTPADIGIGIPSGTPYFVSVAAADAAGHESLFAYPEYRCDTTGCVVPPAALNIIATN
jgi:hypothetical protein